MPLVVIAEPLPGLKILEAPRFGDTRGHFQEVYHRDGYRDAGITAPFVQDNWSRSAQGTVRGLHYQLQFPQAKLIQVIRGSILDVVVDIRRGSPTFGQSYAVDLSDTLPKQLYVPEGFAHGFCTRSETVDLLYKCSALYHPGDEYGISWNDPDLEIPWPEELLEQPLLSDKDRALPRLADVPEAQLPTWPT